MIGRGQRSRGTGRGVEHVRFAFLSAMRTGVREGRRAKGQTGRENAGSHFRTSAVKTSPPRRSAAIAGARRSHFRLDSDRDDTTRHLPHDRARLLLISPFSPCRCAPDTLLPTSPSSRASRQRRCAQRSPTLWARRTEVRHTFPSLSSARCA